MARRRSSGPVVAARTRSGVIGGREGAVLTRGYIRGASDLRAALAGLESRVLQTSLMRDAVLASAKVLEEAWQEEVLARIGIGPGVAHYAEAIEARARRGRTGATGLVGLKDVPVSDGEAHPREYASRFEFGSTKRSLEQLKTGRTIAGRTRAAVPTLRPAFDRSVVQMFDVMADELRRGIENAASQAAVASPAVLGRDARGRFVRVP